MTNLNILITSAGVATACNVIAALRESKRYNVKIVACDMDELSPGLYLSDKFYIVPPFSSENFINKILEICSKEKIQFIFPLFSEEIEIFAKHKNQFQNIGIDLILPDLEVIKLCNNKKQFLKFLEVNKLDYPKTYSGIETGISFPVFIKPMKGSSSKGTKIIHDYPSLSEIENINYYLIQEFIDWDEYTVDCYINKKDKPIAIIPRIRKKVREGKTMVGITKKNPEIIKTTELLLNRLNYRGACNVQLFFKDNKCKIIEVNPRLSAGGLPLAIKAGANIPELMIADSLNQLKSQQIDFKENLTMLRYLTEVFIKN